MGAYSLAAQKQTPLLTTTAEQKTDEAKCANRQSDSDVGLTEISLAPTLPVVLGGCIMIMHAGGT